MCEEYFKKQFKWSMLKLEHNDPSDFYLSSCQHHHSSVPLLVIRIKLFLACLALLLLSTITTCTSFHYWPIYLTHWGLVINVISTTFGLAVSIKAAVKRSEENKLPWHIRAYWVVSNISITTSFFISAFYWFMLADTVEECKSDILIDVLIHLANTCLMLVPILATRQPWHLLHFYMPLAVALLYVLFTLIYYFAGGTNPNHHTFIYPLLNWNDPAEAVPTAVAAFVMVVILHFVGGSITEIRDAIIRWCRRRREQRKAKNAQKRNASETRNI